MSYTQMQEELDKNKVFDKAIVEQCADDFYEAFGGDEELKLTPADFWSRWQAQGIEIPVDNLHDFFIFFRQVIAVAKENNPNRSDSQ